MIKNVVILTNVIIYNEHHKRDYVNKKGVMVVEDENNKKIVLDLQSMTDITNSDYIKVRTVKGKTKVKTLFQNILYNTDLLEELARGK